MWFIVFTRPRSSFYIWVTICAWWHLPFPWTVCNCGPAFLLIFPLHHTFLLRPSSMDTTKEWASAPFSKRAFHWRLMATTVFQIRRAPTSFYGDELLPLRRSLKSSSCARITGRGRYDSPLRRKGGVGIRCGLRDLIGGDLLKFDLGQWLEDVEKYKALAIYSPHEGGYEGRYLTRLRYKGYYFLDLSARGLGDPEATLTKIHPVCPVPLSLSSSVFSIRR